jgi:hypothetical protein
MFGPVRWFALLMITLLVGSFLPDRLLDRALLLGTRVLGYSSTRKRRTGAGSHGT